MMSNKVSGYKSPRSPFLFFRNDWHYGIEVAEEISGFEQDLDRLMPEDAELSADYSFHAHKTGPEFQGIGMESLEEIFERLDEYDNLITGRVEYEVGDSTGEIFYETSLPGEGAGRISAEFEIADEEDPVLEEAITTAVHENFNSFAGWNLPGKHPKQYAQRILK